MAIASSVGFNVKSFAILKLFATYDVDHWNHARLVERDCMRLAWKGPNGVDQLMDMPRYDAPEPDWHEFFTLLEMRLKLM